VTAMLPAFENEGEAELLVPWTFDFNVAATKYFAVLKDGDIPLSLLFSGTVFVQGQPFGLQASQLPWDRETLYRLPVRVWHEDFTANRIAGRIDGCFTASA